jgi:ubiquitin carboxyl-terminal hydrolase 5/13
MSCPHQSSLKGLQPPKLSQSVHREECTQCFDDQDSPLGIDICLHCFNGGCLSPDRHHARTHAQRSGHDWTLNIKRKLKDSWVEQKRQQRRGDSDPDGEPPAKMTKLAIVQEREEDKYEWVYEFKCWKCDPNQGAAITPDPETSKKLIEGISTSMSSGRQSEVQAWEEEINPCEHALILEQEPMVFGAFLVFCGWLSLAESRPKDLTKCNACELTSNLWLCLTCGSLGCGRQQFGGVGGNGHGMAHYGATGHPVSVKLGTITPEGNAGWSQITFQSNKD